MLFKTVREQARINSLLKNLAFERRQEKDAWKMFTEIYGQVTGWAQDATEEQQHFKLEFLPDEISVSDIKMNIKMFKMIFNRAIRVKSRDVKQGEKMFLYLVE